jgi:hypothetical protein
VALLTDIVVDYVSFVDRAAVRDPHNKSEPQRFLIYKRDNPSQEDSMTPEEKAALEKAQADAQAAEQKLAKTEADLTAANDKLAKQDEQIEALTKSVEDIKKAAGITDPAPTKIDKSALDPAVREALEKAEEREAALAARLEKAEKAQAEADELAKAERGERLTREFVAKAEGFKSLSQKPAEFGPVLKSASEKLSKEEFAEIERVLTAADNALETAGIFAEQGRSGDGPDDGDTAIAKATKAAAEIRKNDSSITPAGALQQAFKADPDLAARYQDEVRAAA